MRISVLARRAIISLRLRNTRGNAVYVLFAVSQTAQQYGQLFPGCKARRPSHQVFICFARLLLNFPFPEV